MVAIGRHKPYQWPVTRAELYEATRALLFHKEITKAYRGPHLHVLEQQTSRDKLYDKKVRDKYGKTIRNKVRLEKHVASRGHNARHPGHSQSDSQSVSVYRPVPRWV